MKEQRKKEIKAEATRRLELWLSNSSFNEMSHHGSLMVFNMMLALRGCEYVKPQWMDKDDFGVFVTNYEYNSAEYDLIIEELFNKFAIDREIEQNKNYLKQ